MDKKTVFKMRSICTAEYNSIGKTRMVCFVGRLAWGKDRRKTITDAQTKLDNVRETGMAAACGSSG